VKDFFVHRIALRLALPFIVAICVLIGGTNPAMAAKTARVQIGFLGVPPTGFQNVLLNVVAVRINPHANAAPTNGGWQKIPAPPGIGGGFNAELQIDLNSSQNVPQLFNTAGTRPSSYRIAQLILDSTNPGSLIPNCPGPSADGCINYPIQLVNPNGITLSAMPGGPPLITTATGTLTSFVLQATVTITKFPTAPGGAYTVSIVLAPTANVAIGTVTGQVTVTPGTGSGTSTTGKVRKLTVTAQAIGTNTTIATAPVKAGVGDCKATSPSGCFTLALPAAGPPAPATPFGTLYDLAVSGGADTYAAVRLQPLYPSGSITANFGVTGNQTLGNITGTVSDGCAASKTISSATLQLLIPPDPIAKMKPPPLPTFCITSPEQCISVATATTDPSGNFPQPGTATTPTSFANVPILAKGSKGYVMEVTAPGYDPLFVLAQPGNGTNKKGGGTCSLDGGATFNTCDLSMMTGYIAGAFAIVPPNPGQTAVVQVFAEDHDTNNVESALPMGITVGSNPNVTGCSPPDGTVCANFKLNVPPSIPIGAFDLFAATIDTYQGVADPYQGHSIVAISDVPAPAACATVTVPTTTDPNQVISCVGHGSIAGSVGNANLGASVVLEKLDPEGPPNDNEVQITSSLVQNQSPTDSDATNRVSFCAPADTYQLQEFQLPRPAPNVPIAIASPSPVPDGDAIVTVPTPPPAGGGSPTPTPAIKCPTNCSHPDGTCPGICFNEPPGLPAFPPLPTPTQTMTPTATATP